MNFENVHRNKKIAFLDGFLSALAITYIVRMFKQDYDEDKYLKNLRNKPRSSTN